MHSPRIPPFHRYSGPEHAWVLALIYTRPHFRPTELGREILWYEKKTPGRILGYDSVFSQLMVMHFWIYVYYSLGDVKTVMLTLHSWCRPVDSG